MTNHIPTTALLAAALLFTGCGSASQDTTNDGALADSADVAAADLAREPTPAALDPEDPCRLLQAAEVEAVLGAPLAVAPYRSQQPNGDSAGEPAESGDWCWYESDGGRNLAIAFEREQGGAILSGVGGYLAKAEAGADGLLKLQDGTELVGDWDEVKMLGCCDFMALQGDSLVEVDFGGSLATAVQAGELANLALSRLDAPLATDGRAALAAAQRRYDARYSSNDACSLWTRQDIERLLGPVQGEPERSGMSCSYAYRDKNGRKQMFNATTVLRNGYRNFRSDNPSFSAMAAGIQAMAAEGGIGLKATTELEGPWDAAQDDVFGFSSVRRDAAISVRYSRMDADELRALVGHGYDRIEAGAQP